MTLEQFKDFINKEIERMAKHQAQYEFNEFLPKNIEHPDCWQRLQERQRAYREGFDIGAHVIFEKMSK